MDFMNKKTINKVWAREKKGLAKTLKKYDDPATKYAVWCLDNPDEAGYEMRLVMLRHLLDLQECEKNTNYEYMYDLDEYRKLKKIMDFYPDFEDTSRKFNFLPFQEMFLAIVNCWKLKDRPDTVRFNDISVSMSRDNGKSVLGACQLSYDFIYKSYHKSSQELLVAATDTQKTQKTFRYVKQVLRHLLTKTPFKILKDEAQIDILETQVNMRANSNIIQTKTLGGSSFDSAHYLTAILDEVGELESFKQVDEVFSGQERRNDVKTIKFSTAYRNSNVPFKKTQDTFFKAVERRDGSLERTLVLNWSQDSEEEVREPDKWIKSCPLMAMSEQSREDTTNKMISSRDKKELEGNLDEFIVKNLNVWINAKANAYLKEEEIEEAILPKDEAELIISRAQDFYAGFDYSMTNDNTAFAFLYPYLKNGIQMFHVSQFSFIPWRAAGSIEAKGKSEGMNYTTLQEQGFCKITSHERGIISKDEVSRYIQEIDEESRYSGKNMLLLGYDAMGVNNIIKSLEANSDINLLAIRQDTGTLKDTVKTLQELFVERRITIDDDPILIAALKNAVVGENRVGMYIDKMSAKYKIDVVDAIIDALFQGQYHFENYGGVQELKGFSDRSENDAVDFYDNFFYN